VAGEYALRGVRERCTGSVAAAGIGRHEAADPGSKTEPGAPKTASVRPVIMARTRAQKPARKSMKM
jgi:hypothetical protein